MPRRTSIYFTVSAGLLSAGLAAVALAADFTASPPRPSGAIRVARPLLEWRLRPAEGMQVTKVTLTVDGQNLSAQYDADRHAVVGTPSAGLASGPHRAKCVATLSNGSMAEQEWEFMVIPGAVPELPIPNAQQLASLETANELRKSVGLLPFRLDPRLCAAAEAHAQYLVKNDTRGHFEDPGRPGFTGERPSHRYAAQGYGGAIVAEDVVSGDTSPEDTVHSVFDPPYHRLTFFQPEPSDIGFAFAKRGNGDGIGGVALSTTIDAPPTEPRVVVYPPDGGTGIPVSLRMPEAPDSLRLHGARLPVGYVITFVYFAPGEPKIRVKNASLMEGGKPVPFFLNTPENDEEIGGAGAFLIPKSALKAGATYAVSVEAETTDGKDISRRWSFTTGKGSKKRRG
jgi:hypothetical protein